MLCLSVCLAVVAACDVDDDADHLLAAINERGSLRVVTDADYPPLSMLDNGVWSGFDVEVGKELARRLGVEVELLHGNWDEVVSGVWGDRWDISVGSMTPTDERERLFHFVQPSYYYDVAQFGVHVDSGINTYADLEGKSVCTASDTTYERWFQGILGIPPDQILVADPPANMSIITEEEESVCSEKIKARNTGYDVIIASDAVVYEGIQDGFLKKIGDPVFLEGLSVAVTKSHSKDPTSLVEELGTIVQAMHDDGKLSAMAIESFGHDRSQQPQ